MSSAANGRKIQDLEQELLMTKTDYYTNEKQDIEADKPRKSDIMPSIRQFLLTLMVVSLLTITIVSAATTNRSPGNVSPCMEDQQAFSELLDTLEPAMLHDVLHQHMREKYQHGVYEDDKEAIEAVHRQEPGVAHALVAAAKANAMIELAKRQVGSNSTTTEAPSTTSSAPSSTVITSESVTTSPSSTSVSVAPTSSSVSTTAAASTSAPAKTSATTSATSQAVSPTTSPSSTIPQTSASSTSEGTTSTQAPASTTSASTSASTSAASTSSASSADESSTKAPATTSKKTTISSTSTKVFTTTLPNGSISTVTAITVVPAVVTGGSSGGSSTASGSASLQTNSAGKNNLGVNMILGAVGMVVIGAL